MDLGARYHLLHSSARGNAGIFGRKRSCSAGPGWPVPALWATRAVGPLGILPPTPSLGTGSAPFSAQEDQAPPRPPLPELYSPEDQPPAVPPLPREATIIRHTSVRGLKRQSDERKRDREQGQCVNGDSRVSREDRVAPVSGERLGGTVPGRCDSPRLCPQVELRSYVSEPELTTFSGDAAQPSLGLVGSDSRYQTLPGRGKAALSVDAFWGPPCTTNHCSPTLTRHLAPFCLSFGL